MIRECDVSGNNWVFSPDNWSLSTDTFNYSVKQPNDQLGLIARIVSDSYVLESWDLVDVLGAPDKLAFVFTNKDVTDTLWRPGISEVGPPKFLRPEVVVGRDLGNYRSRLEARDHFNHLLCDSDKVARDLFAGYNLTRAVRPRKWLRSEQPGYVAQLGVGYIMAELEPVETAAFNLDQGIESYKAAIARDQRRLIELEAQRTALSERIARDSIKLFPG